MRIALDGTPLLGDRTGVGWYTAELIEALADEAPEDDIVVLPISWRAAKGMSRPDRANVSVVRRFTPARPLWALWNRMAVPPIEWLVGCDVFHGTNFLAPPSSRVPVVVTVHDLSFIRRPDQCRPGARRFAELLPAVLRRAAGVIAVSAFTRDELADWMPEVGERVTVIPPASHSRSAPSMTPSGVDHPAGGHPYVLVLGSLAPRKNIPLALDAFVVLRQRRSDLCLVLAGPPDPLLDVGALLAERGLAPPEVVCTGYVDDARAAALLAGAEMLAFPSRYEGFGMPLLEAMAAGVPVVASRAGVTPETVGDAAVLVDPDDVEGFADAIARVADDAELRTTLVAAGRARSALFTWTATAKATLGLYRRVADAG